MYFFISKLVFHCIPNTVVSIATQIQGCVHVATQQAAPFGKKSRNKVWKRGWTHGMLGSMNESVCVLGGLLLLSLATWWKRMNTAKLLRFLSKADIKWRFTEIGPWLTQKETLSHNFNVNYQNTAFTTEKVTPPYQHKVPRKRLVRGRSHFTANKLLMTRLSVTNAKLIIVATNTAATCVVIRITALLVFAATIISTSLFH